MQSPSAWAPFLWRSRKQARFASTRLKGGESQASAKIFLAAEPPTAIGPILGRRMRINRGTVGVGTVGVTILLALAGCNADAIAIASKDLGPQWPFTVPEVRGRAPPFSVVITRLLGVLG